MVHACSGKICGLIHVVLLLQVYSDGIIGASTEFLRETWKVSQYVAELKSPQVAADQLICETIRVKPKQQQRTKEVRHAKNVDTSEGSCRQ